MKKGAAIRTTLDELREVFHPEIPKGWGECMSIQKLSEELNVSQHLILRLVNRNTKRIRARKIMEQGKWQWSVCIKDLLEVAKDGRVV